MKIAKAVSIIRTLLNQGDCHRRFFTNEEVLKRKEARLTIRQRTGGSLDELFVAIATLSVLLSRHKWSQVGPRLGFAIDGMPKKRFLAKFFSSDHYAEDWKWTAERGGRMYLCSRGNTTYEDYHLKRVPWNVFGNGIKVTLFVSLDLVERDRWVEQMNCPPPWELAPVKAPRKRDRSFIKKAPRIELKKERQISKPVRLRVRQRHRVAVKTTAHTNGTE